MEEKANTGQVIIVLTEHLTFGTLLIPYMAEKSDDGTYQLIEQAFHASPRSNQPNERSRATSYRHRLTLHREISDGNHIRVRKQYPVFMRNYPKIRNGKEQ